jgi:hypothetical protein
VGGGLNAASMRMIDAGPRHEVDAAAGPEETRE